MFNHTVSVVVGPFHHCGNNLLFHCLKKGNGTIFSNYILIPTRNNFAKIFEFITYDRLFYFLSTD
jgi:hypothetical protein